MTQVTPNRGKYLNTSHTVKPIRITDLNRSTQLMGVQSVLVAPKHDIGLYRHHQRHDCLKRFVALVASTNDRNIVYIYASFAV